MGINSNRARLSNHLRRRDFLAGIFDFRVDFIDGLGSQKKAGPRVTLAATANRLRQALSVARQHAELSGGQILCHVLKADFGNEASGHAGSARSSALGH